MVGVLDPATVSIILKIIAALVTIITLAIYAKYRVKIKKETKPDGSSSTEIELEPWKA